MSIGKRIKQLRRAKGMSQAALAQASGVSQQMISKLELEKSDATAEVVQIAAALDTTGEYLEFGADAARRADDGDVEVPLWSATAAAGDGSSNDSGEKLGGLRFRAYSLRRKNLNPQYCHVFFVRGDSMSPRLKSGDAILFDTSDLALRDSCIYVMRMDGDVVVKRLRLRDGTWMIVSDNTDDPKWAGRERPLPIGDIDFAVIGRVRWVGSWED